RQASFTASDGTTNMRRFFDVVPALLIALLIVAAPLWYKQQHDRRVRSFHVVEEGVLYRSGQMDLAGLKRIVHDYGIKTIVSLRDGETGLDQDEAEWALKTGINHVRIPPRPWWAPDGAIPGAIGLAEFRRVLAEPANQPVLVHCFAGIHRT